MKLPRRMILGAGMAVLLAQTPARARADEGTNPVPDFKEVSELISAHLAGETGANLNRDAVLGLLHELHGKVSLVAGKTEPVTGTNALVLSKSVLYDGSIAYLRVGTVADGLAGQISAACKELSGTNELKGVVLDLRFADGQDYAAAAAAADLFLSKERPLLDWGNGVVQSKAKPDAVNLPLVILVNQETAAAAEALAAMLREDNRSILLGANTAGEATMSQEFPLKDGQYLRIATAGIKLGDGETLSTKGIKPDIEVNVKPDDERAYFADPFKEIPSSLNLIATLTGETGTNTVDSTNRAPRARQLNEAELMRERKERPGMELDEEPPPMSASDLAAEKPVIRDPVLGRALDLIKGIAVIRRASAP